jgi:hypothetical protein
VSEVDLVEVEVEDFVLREALLDAVGEDHLADLASELALGAQQQALHHLLRNGAGALSDLAAGAQVHPDRPQDRRVIDAGVLEEGVVLAGHEGEHHVPGDLVELRQLPPLAVELADQPALAVEHVARQGGPVIANVAQVREVPHECDVAGEGPREDDQREHASGYERDPKSTRSKKSHSNSGGYPTVAESDPVALPLPIRGTVSEWRALPGPSHSSWIPRSPSTSGPTRPSC